MKASKPTGELKPFNIKGHSNKNRLVYIGNIYNTDNEDRWMKAGTELRAYDLFRRVLVKKIRRGEGDKHSSINMHIHKLYHGELRPTHFIRDQHPLKRGKDQAKQPGHSKYHTVLRKGIERGDCFLTFGSGKAYVVRKRRDGEGYWLCNLKAKERKLVLRGERITRRNLRWDTGSFCYGQSTKDWAANLLAKELKSKGTK
jgi:hypothetical protein